MPLLLSSVRTRTMEGFHVLVLVSTAPSVQHHKTSSPWAKRHGCNDCYVQRLLEYILQL